MEKESTKIWISLNKNEKTIALTDKGSFINYVRMILAIFDSPTPCKGT